MHYKDSTGRGLLLKTGVETADCIGVSEDEMGVGTIGREVVRGFGGGGVESGTLVKDRCNIIRRGVV